MTEPIAQSTNTEITATDSDNQLEAAWLVRLESTLNKLTEAMHSRESGADPELKTLLQTLVAKLSAEPTTADLSKAETVVAQAHRKSWLTKRSRGRVPQP